MTLSYLGNLGHHHIQEIHPEPQEEETNPNNIHGKFPTTNDAIKTMVKVDLELIYIQSDTLKTLSNNKRLKI